MKGFINKRDKIKWEDTPFQPEFTEESIKKAVDKYFPVSTAEPEQGDYLMWDDSHAIWGPHTPHINDNTDVTTTDPEDGQILVFDTDEWSNVTLVLNLADDVNITTPAEGDTLVYDATAGEWKNKAPATWHALDPVTADGVETTYEISLQDAVALVVWLDVKQGSADDTVNFNASFDGTNYPRIANIGTLIAAAGERWGRVESTGEGGLWRTVQTNAASAVSANVGIVTRNDTLYFNNSPMKSIRISATSPLPEGSVIQVYAKY